MQDIKLKSILQESSQFTFSFEVMSLFLHPCYLFCDQLGSLLLQPGQLARESWRKSKQAMLYFKGLNSVPKIYV